MVFLILRIVAAAVTKIVLTLYFAMLLNKHVHLVKSLAAANVKVLVNVRNVMQVPFVSMIIICYVIPAHLNAHPVEPWLKNVVVIKTQTVMHQKFVPRTNGNALRVTSMVVRNVQVQPYAHSANLETAVLLILLGLNVILAFRFAAI